MCSPGLICVADNELNMSQPDDIQRFVRETYITPAKERSRDTLRLSARTIQETIGGEVTLEAICRALDTLQFLGQVGVSLVRRTGTVQDGDAAWTFGVSLRHQRGELLVAVLKRKRDLAILQKEGWYRIPVSTAPSRWPPRWIAFFPGDHQLSRWFGRRRIGAAQVLGRADWQHPAIDVV